MNIKIVTDTITIDELKDIAKEFYVEIIKGVVDVETGIMAFGGEYHSDANRKLIENGSEQKNVWGFIIHFYKPESEWIEYKSHINVRPEQGNIDLVISDQNLCKKMRSIIDSKLV